MSMITAKFGGSSLKDADMFRQVASIVRSNTDRHFIVASAPGKRDSQDTKVTDLLIAWYAAAGQGGDTEPIVSAIRQRFQDIVDGLGMEFDLEQEFRIIQEHIAAGAGRDYVVSRGEYLNSRLLAAYLGFEFIDAADYICFDEEGAFDGETTNTRLTKALEDIQYGVVPGFYGARADGTIVTFSRGGSDVTGSIVARACRADLYENWTDVSGMLAADPRVVEDPKVIEYITYRELRELSYMGASVLHEDAIFPVRRMGITINIRNTNRPEDPGTMIVAQMPEEHNHRAIRGIAGKKGFSSIQIEKSLMNNEVGFVAKLLNIFDEYGLPFEHMPSGIDTISVIVNTEHFETMRLKLLNEIDKVLHPDTLYVQENLAMIAVVGQGLSGYKGLCGGIFRALGEADVNVRMIDQGSGELNIIIGVDHSDYETAVNAIYKAVIA